MSKMNYNLGLFGWSHKSEEYSYLITTYTHRCEGSGREPVAISKRLLRRFAPRNDSSRIVIASLP